jgi:putative tryptophan/tyrosine transport system substrate-binding protein
VAKRGWEEGRNIQIDYRFAAAGNIGTGQYQALAKQLIALQPDVILTQTPVVTAALQQHENRSIPTVFVNVSDPIGMGFKANLARPGGNITGMLHYEGTIVGKWLGMLKEIAPRGSAANLAEAKSLAQVLKGVAQHPQFVLLHIMSRVDDVASISAGE